MLYTTVNSSRIFKCTVALGFGALSELAFCTVTRIPGLAPGELNLALGRNARRRANRNANKAEAAELQNATVTDTTVTPILSHTVSDSESAPPNAAVLAAKTVQIPDNNLTDVFHDHTSTAYNSESSNKSETDNHSQGDEPQPQNLDQELPEFPSDPKTAASYSSVLLSRNSTSSRPKQAALISGGDYYNESSSRAHYKIPTSKWVNQHLNEKKHQIEYELLFKETREIQDSRKNIDIYEVQRRDLKKIGTQSSGILGAKNSTSVANDVSASESRNTWVQAGPWNKMEILITVEKDFNPKNPFHTGIATPLIGKWWLKFQVKHYLEGRLYNNQPQAPQYDMYFYEYTPEAHSTNPQSDSVKLEWKVTPEERQREKILKELKLEQLRKDKASADDLNKAEKDNGKLDVTYKLITGSEHDIYKIFSE